MIFDPQTNSLYSDKGEFIKTVYCPMSLRPEQLRLMDGKRDRYCLECKTEIKCIDLLSDEDVKSAAAEDKGICIFSTPEARNIVFLRQTGEMEENHEHLPVITTLRNLPAMDYAAACGLKLVFRNVSPENAFGSHKYIVFQNTKTGRLWWSGDYRRCFPENASTLYVSEDQGRWTEVRKWFWVRSDRPFPLAAYAIPKTLEPGEKVFIEELIEDRSVELWNQGDSSRVQSCYGVWTGSDLIPTIPQRVGIVG